MKTTTKELEKAMERLKRTLEKRGLAPTANKCKETFERLRRAKIRGKPTPTTANKDGSQPPTTEDKNTANIKQTNLN